MATEIIIKTATEAESVEKIASGLADILDVLTSTEGESFATVGQIVDGLRDCSFPSAQNALSDYQRQAESIQAILFAHGDSGSGPKRWVDIKAAAQEAIREAFRAVDKYHPFNSRHEGYAILLEEVDELFDAIKANDHAGARKEAVQVAAMALRFIAEFPEEPTNAT